MRIGKYTILFPILIGLEDRKHQSTFYTSDDKSLVFSIKIRPLSRMGGTTKTTTFIADIQIGSWIRQFSFCWRWDVTHYYLIREPRYRKMAEHKAKASK